MNQERSDSGYQLVCYGDRKPPTASSHYHRSNSYFLNHVLPSEESCDPSSALILLSTSTPPTIEQEEQLSEMFHFLPRCDHERYHCLMVQQENLDNDQQENSKNIIYSTRACIVHRSDLLLYYEELMKCHLLTEDEQLFLVELRNDSFSDRNYNSSIGGGVGGVIGIRDIVATDHFLFVLTMCGRVFFHNYFDRDNTTRSKYGHIGVHPLLDLVPGQLVRLLFCPLENIDGDVDGGDHSNDTNSGGDLMQHQQQLLMKMMDGDNDSASSVRIKKIVVSDQVSFFITDEGAVWACGETRRMGYCEQELSNYFPGFTSGWIIHPICMSDGPLRCDYLKDRKVIDIGFMPMEPFSYAVLFLCEDLSLVQAALRGASFISQNISHVKYAQVQSTRSRSRVAMLSDDGNVFVFGKNKVGEMGMGDTNLPFYMPTKMNQAMFQGECVVSVDMSEMNSFFTTESGRVFASGELGYHRYSTMANQTPKEILFDRSLTVRNVFPTTDFCIYQTQVKSDHTVHDEHTNPSSFELYIQCAADAPSSNTVQPLLLSLFKKKQVIRSCTSTDIHDTDLRLTILCFQEDTTGRPIQHELFQKYKNGSLSDITIQFCPPSASKHP